MVEALTKPQAHACAKKVRISADKIRQVLPLIRGKEAALALSILKYTPKKGAGFVEKVLMSAMANAEHNFGMDLDKLVVHTAFADQGTFMKRFRPVSMGRAHRYRHHTCCITVAVAER